MQCTDRFASRRSSLGNVALIQPGYSSRSRVDGSSEGTHRLVQAKDVSPDGVILWDEVVSFHPERAPDLYQIRPDDILILARGRNHRATLVSDCRPRALASSVFYILRPTRDRVTPSYLEWWLNLPEVQSQINAVSRGTGIAYLQRQSLAEISVDLPPMDVQKKIDAVVSLRRRRNVLQTHLDLKRRELIDAVCKRAASDGKVLNQ